MSREDRRRAYELQYGVRAVLEPLGQPTTLEGFDEALRKIDDLERFRTAQSAALIDALREVVEARARHDDTAIVDARYLELQAAIHTFQVRTNTIRRSAPRILVILSATSVIATAAAFAADRLARIMMTGVGVSPLISAGSEPLRQIAVILEIVIVCGAMGWAIHRVRPGYDLTLVALLAVVSGGLPINLAPWIFGLAAALEDLLVQAIAWPFGVVILRAPFYALLTAAAAVAGIVLFDWLWRRSARKPITSTA